VHFVFFVLFVIQELTTCNSGQLTTDN
jgi:hypothetical protein